MRIKITHHNGDTEDIRIKHCGVSSVGYCFTRFDTGEQTILHPSSVLKIEEIREDRDDISELQEKVERLSGYLGDLKERVKHLEGDAMLGLRNKK